MIGKMVRTTLSCALLSCSVFLSGQTIQINEIMASNQTTLFDEDGDAPDWIELYNSTSNMISLHEWGLTDDPEELFKWRFPALNLQPSEFLLVMASDKDRKDIIRQWNTIINWGDSWYYFPGTEEPPSNWNLPGFDNSGWETGPSGFGYGDGDDNTVLDPVMSVYIVRSFSVVVPERVKRLALHIDFDDAFVAYLNGIEFARENIGSPGVPPAFYEGADNWREAEMYNGGSPRLFWVDSTISWLIPGENVIAIQVHNYNITSSDMSGIPFFTVGRDTVLSGVPSPPDLLNLPGSLLHTNFKISSSGEPVILTEADSTTADSLFTGSLMTDVSLGRINDGQDMGLFILSTPGQENGDDAYNGILTEPTFSLQTGFYGQNQLIVEINIPDNNGNVHYSLDGTPPTEESVEYSGPISVQSNMVIRARSFQTGWLESPINTQTYILDQPQLGFPTVFLTTDPDNFFDYETGIYVMGPNASGDFPHFGANFWEDWERPIHIGLLETNSTYFSSPAGVKIFGGWSRGNPQKSLALYARSIYGASEFSYSLFPDLDIQTYESFVLRNSGNDWNFSMVRDAYMTGLVDELDVDYQAYRPVATYLNGEFWGLYNLREKINEHFIAGHHPVDPDEIDFLEANVGVLSGSNQDYLSLLDYLDDTSMDGPGVFEILREWIDIDSHINYNIAQIFFDNRDWPGNNIKYWRPQSDGGLWRWILFDTDFGFGIPFMGSNTYLFNTLEFATEPYGPGWPNPPWSTYLLRRLLENPSYSERFINLFCDRLNTIFSPSFLTNRLNEITYNVQEIIPIHNNRWPESAEDWGYQIDIINNFAENRRSYMRMHLGEYFDLSSLASSTFYVSPNQGGKIRINSLVPNYYPWSGYYFPDIPIHVKALPEPGFQFTRWDEFPDSSQAMMIQVNDPFMLTAIFEPLGPGDSAVIVINEINYNSSDSFNSEDWVELHNPGDMDIDLSGWVFKDDDDNHNYIIPEETIISSGDYLILVKDEEMFTAVFPDVSGFVGPFEFGLGGNGELVRVYNSHGTIVDQVEYDDNPPWPTEADGNGPTLELRHPDLENNQAESWAASIDFGSPGEQNSVYETLISNNDHHLPIITTLHHAFPNPFNSSTTIHFDLHQTNKVDLIIYDILGRTVRQLVHDSQQPGFKTIKWDGKDNMGRNVSAGVYFCRLQAGKFQNTIKLAVIK